MKAISDFGARPAVAVSLILAVGGFFTLAGCNDFLTKNVSIGIAGGSSSSSSSDGDDDDGVADDDSDGLSNAVEEAFEMDPLTADTDRDGFADGWEFALNSGEPLNPDIVPTPLNRERILDPEDVRTDSDSDLDGLADTFETERSLDPSDPDTDDDGYSDAIELLASSDPFVSSDRPIRDEPPIPPSQDFIGLPPSDGDRDGLADVIESAEGTQIASRDSDNDGFSDAVEVLSGSDPLASNSIPNLTVPQPPAS